ncbi:universal stress protein [Paraburkholderia sp. EG304]|uniref:universal stress protein n=1 Tax=Paraburkholderia sp. EG304 TaxID=3237015 RepID=UPI0039795B2F
MAAPGAHVRIVSVAEDPRRLILLDPLVGVDLSSVHDELLCGAEDAVTRAKTVISVGKTVVDTEVMDLSIEGWDVAHALLEAARTWQADLLVVGTRQNRRLLGWLEGTISEPLARMCQCSILVVPASYERSSGYDQIANQCDGQQPMQHTDRERIAVNVFHEVGFSLRMREQAR